MSIPGSAAEIESEKTLISRCFQGEINSNMVKNAHVSTGRALVLLSLKLCASKLSTGQHYNTTVGLTDRQLLLLKLAPMNATGFGTNDYLASNRLGNKVIRLLPNQEFFSQGERADSVFFLRSGRAKLTVVSKQGKEATVMLLGAGDFAGEESIVGAELRRISSASTTTVCIVVKIGREEMLRALREESKFSKLFLTYMLHRGQRIQADLVDQLFNGGEKRLARTLLLLSGFDEEGGPEMPIPYITQQTLADMIGTTRPRVNVFMNRFRKLGYIEYNGRTGRIRVQKSLLDAIRTDLITRRGAVEIASDTIHRM